MVSSEKNTKKGKINLKVNSKIVKKLQFFTIAMFIIGFLGGLFISSVLNTKAASSKTVEKERAKIIDTFLTNPDIKCQNNSDTNTNIAIEKNFYIYFRINKFADRAIIRQCATDDENSQIKDSLIYKNKSGFWIKSDVEVLIGYTGQQNWVKACKVDDIIVTDDQVKVDNASIAENNLIKCKELKRL